MWFVDFEVGEAQRRWLDSLSLWMQSTNIIKNVIGTYDKHLLQHSSSGKVVQSTVVSHLHPLYYMAARDAETLGPCGRHA